MEYPLIPNTVPPPHSVVPPLSPNEPLPPALTSPKPPTENSKSIFAFWHSGLESLPPYLLRNVINWYRRFSPLGWTIHVLDNVPGSPLNVSNYIDVASPSVVPAAFTSNTLNGEFPAHHTSDLVRFPLLLRYGGVYLDVSVLQFGDLDWLWEERIMAPSSPCEFAGFTMGEPPEISIVNFAFMCAAGNALVRRAHYILLELWGNRTNTTGMHRHPLVEHVPLLRVAREVALDEEGQEKMVVNDEAMTDYAAQIQCMGAAQRWVDAEDGWDGPKYVREKCWLLSMVESAYVGEQLTNWNGQRFFDLLALQLPGEGERENEDQRLAREIVEKSVAESWCLKLMHGFSAKVFGRDTLGILWRQNEGSDCREGTYAGWLRWAEVNCAQVSQMEPMKIPVYKPTRMGKLLP